jgi:glyoxylase-like metal-dependent hydrolase (beta-lactamase superfamily II)
MARMQLAVIPVTPFEQNCSVLWCEKTLRAAVIDPGGGLDDILAFVGHQKLTLEKILITHAHVDHAAATAELARRCSLPIEGPHPDDQFWIDDLPARAAEYGFPPAQVFVPTRWLKHGDEVTVGEVHLQVIHCPGHTPGHVVFYSPVDHFAVVGDVIFAGSIGRTDFPRGNHADLIRSIRERLFTLGDDVKFLPGHGPVSSFGAERRSNPFVGDAAVRRG